MLRLYDGQKIPVIGMGTLNIIGKAKIPHFKEAIDIGYRMFDTAHIYHNETNLGTAIRESIAEGKVSREDLYIVSKLGPQFHQPDLVEKGCRISLERLGLDYIDLYLLNSPVAFVHQSDQYTFPPTPQQNRPEFDDELTPTRTWRALEMCKRKGLARALGVSNFNEEQLCEILDDCEVKPAVNQVECSVGFRQDKLRKFCTDNGILVMAHSPLGNPRSCPPECTPFLRSPVLTSVASICRRTTAQVAIRYLMEKGTIPIPKSTNRFRMAENLNVFDFDIAEIDMNSLDENIEQRRTASLNWMRGSVNCPFELNC
ncbi:aldo-keto reductase family 1 member D1-like [Toxorhynchites rutilus septentrionalis]|uniref:aldo-keto reductase family 1 member D1-like n=1 Tax=Toxorhynchites rutilus septentrionalis TaxID=329112 RepID=UPI00247A709D|nr:aldo-keto reductase family 1 member D1-like [Toxorhynchites rutilus septentrionalis]